MELQYGEYKEIAQDPIFKVKVKDLREKNGLSKKNFHNRTNTLDDFALYEHYNRKRKLHWDSSWYDKYINNFNNIVNEDAGVQQSLNLRMDCCV